MRAVLFVPTFAGWQPAARAALAAGHPPERLFWQEQDADQCSLGLGLELDPAESSPPTAAPTPAPAPAPPPARTPAPAPAGFRVPRAFVDLAARVACHRAPSRWARLYRVLWRLTHGEPHLLAVTVDPDIDALLRMDQAVRRDIHKMRAFVRFRVVERDGQPWHVAWFEPAHHIVERNAAFFIDRFAGLRWSILTPDRCAHWDGAALTLTAGVPRSAAPDADAMEDLWRTYYAHIFNPARVKTHAMQAEMPQKYWRNLPEAKIIPALLAAAPQRTAAMLTRSRQQSRPAPPHPPDNPFPPDNP